jgi:hypothetical protein
MRIDVTCVDLTTGARVADVGLTCTVKLAPRIMVPVPVPAAAGSPAARTVAGAQRPAVDDDPDRPTTIQVVERDAVVLPARTASSTADGRASFEVGLAGTYRQLVRRYENDDRFVDVAAFVRIRGRVDGLDRESPFLEATTSRQSPSGDVTVERAVVVDLAKTIVGHTSDRAVRLWFQLHGTQLPGHRYECDVRSTRSGAPGAQTVSVSFDENRARTSTVDVTGLRAGEAYTYRLMSRVPTDPSLDRVLCAGAFRTVSAEERALTVMFGSCFKPLDTGTYDPTRDLQHWRRLADRSDGDIQLFLGDQIYGDEVPRPPEGQRWYDGYVRRYNAFWAFQPVRQALARRPTYMITDDHEVKDDWGVGHIPAARIRGARDAFRTYQLAHSPSGFAGSLHYHFRRGPVAFFMMDARDKRGTSSDFPVFGEEQWRDLVAWARSPEAQTADVIVFGSPVPVALLPIEDLREAIEHSLEQAGILLGAGIGAVFGGVGAVVGATIGAVGAEVTYRILEATKLADTDYREMWTVEANQKELVRLLNVLFNLANDIDFSDPDAGPGTRPRAVFVLGGDCHFGLIHLLASDRRGGPDHGLNPQIMQLTSSAIGRPPQDSGAMRLLFRDVDESPRDYGDIVDTLTHPFARKATRFVLDDREDEHYRAEALGALFERNLGRLAIERIGEGRYYTFAARIEGEEHDLEQVFEVDLDRRPVRWRTHEPALGLSPPVISFGSVPVGETETRTLTIENFTGRDQDVAISPPPAGPIAWSPFRGTLAHRARRTVTARFTSTGRLHTATMTITSGATERPQSVGLTGKGVGGFPQPDPDDPTPFPTRLAISPLTITFGSVPAGQTVTRTLTIENGTGRSVDVSVSAPPAGPITWTPFAGALAHGARRSITTRFTSGGQIATATMTITSDTPHSPQRVGLTGKGPGGFPTPGPGLASEAEPGTAR